ncbi:MAG: nuclear transport factor 2 family protein [Acetobacteraceae bacterium]|nr:nuclear transport factor 2 family protein [Acetobacteraceae bacterium]
MSSKKDVFRRSARSVSAGDPGHVAEWFTEDFALHDPSIGGLRSGHDGARDMLRSRAEHVPSAGSMSSTWSKREQGRCAVAFSATKAGRAEYLSAVATYRFEGDRIAEDWGIAKADWPVEGDLDRVA